MSDNEWKAPETLAEAWLQSDCDAAMRAQIRADVMATTPEYLQKRPADQDRDIMLRSWRLSEIAHREQLAGVAIPYTGEGLADALKRAREAYRLKVYGHR
jgi:hypothetical protein